MLQSIFKKFAALKACNFIRKEIASQVLFCLHCKIFENDTAIFIEHFRWLLLTSDVTQRTQTLNMKTIRRLHEVLDITWMPYTCSLFWSCVERVAFWQKQPFTGVLSKRCFERFWKNSQESTCVGVPILIKSQASRLNVIKKDTLVQVFSCELSGDYQIFQVWPYLNTQIKIKLPFSNPYQKKAWFTLFVKKGSGTVVFLIISRYKLEKKFG